MSDSSIYCYKKYSKSLEPERQDVLEMALDWVSYRDYRDCGLNKAERIESYMLEHRYDDNADDVLNFYKTVIDWVNDIFFHDYTPKSYQSLASQDWVKMYLNYSNITNSYTDEQKIHITKRCKFLIGLGADLYSKSDGIYEWVLRGEKMDEVNEYLSLRTFKPEDRVRMYNSQGGIDPIDGLHYDITEMEAHHIKPWRLGGPTDYDNMVMLCKKSHSDIDILGLTPDDVRKKRDDVRKRQGNL